VGNLAEGGRLANTQKKMRSEIVSRCGFLYWNSKIPGNSPKNSEKRKRATTN